jgi:copper homeostasis protein
MKLELCAASLEAIQIAKELNFDRIELCQNLEQGGITPYYGMIEYALAYGIETHVLIRPRPGGFHYNYDETEVMLREVINCKNMGAHGIVIGGLTQMGTIDREFLLRIMEKAKGMEVTFHRAFDDAVEWKRSIDTLVDCGVNRILSSGLARNVDLGFPVLKDMLEYSQHRIQVMVGGGVNAANILKIKEELKPAAIHLSGTVKFQLDEESLFSESILKVDKARISRMVEAMKS